MATEHLLRLITIITPGLASMSPPRNSSQEKMEDQTSQQCSDHMKHYKPLGYQNQDPLSFYKYHVNYLNTEIIFRSFTERSKMGMGLQSSREHGASSSVGTGRR